nr:putative transcription elongation factor SPT5 homolog 1 [Tanacetum cinerariifolium]
PGSPRSRAYEAPTPGSGWANTPVYFSMLRNYDNELNVFNHTDISKYNVDDNGGLCIVGGDTDGPWFLPNILVNVRRSGDDAALGVIREVLLDGACRVALGANGDGEIITASPDEIKIVAPNKSDKIKIMSGAQREATGKLIGVDGSDGIVKLDETLDVKILELNTNWLIFVMSTGDHPMTGLRVLHMSHTADRQMHNNIMAVGSRDRPPMLAPGRYPQWRSRFLRYVDTKPNGPYKPSTLLMLKLVKTYSINHQGLTDHKQHHQNPQFHPDHTHLKEIAKPITPPSETASEEDNDPKQAQRDKDMQNNLALIVKYFKKIYKPTNNNLRTSSNSKNKSVDTTPWYKNDDHSGQFGNQRTVNVVAPREKVRSTVVQKSGIQCFNCKEYGHFAKECRKPKRVKDSAYHKVKMLLCKQVEQGVPLQAEHYMAKIQEVPIADSGTDSEPVEQVQNDTGYNVFANALQHSEQSESVSNICLVETDDSNVTPDSPDMCEDDIQNDQNDVESDDGCAAFANLIANLKLDVDENKNIQKKLKKANTTLAQELKEYKSILAKTSQSMRESISVRESCLVALQTKHNEIEKYKAFSDRTVDYDKLERKLNDALGQIAHKYIVINKGLKTKANELLVVKEKHDELMKQSILTKSHYEGQVKQKTKVITDLKLREEHDIEKMLSMEKQIKLILDGEETLALERESRSKLNKDKVRPYDYTNLNSLYEIFKPPTQEYETQLAHTNEIRRKMW